MAVYTSLTLEELQPLLAVYNIDHAISLKGIAAGVENSNFLLTTRDLRYILTLYEKRVNSEDLPFFLTLLNHLAERDIPCPKPIEAMDGQLLHRIKERPAALVSFLEGTSPATIYSYHLSELGKQLAHMHLAGQDFPLNRRNNFSLERWGQLFELVKDKGDRVKPGLVAEIHAHLLFLQDNWPTDLPQGVIHADLFPDNVFFQGRRLSGVIDFYFACNDFLMYDLAICLNAWCFEVSGEFNITKAQFLLSGYHSVRPIELKEFAALPILAKGAALRFLLTRLYDWLNKIEGALVQLKDPLEYLRKLRFHHGITNPSSYGFDVAIYERNEK